MSNSSKRILATIMFTDMVGYTALMQEDEALARKKRKRHKEVFDQLHEKYQGQIVQYFGDGTLSIFQNALDAVHCAIDLQLGLKEPIEVPLRIGLHLGEVVWEEDQLVGDAVNVASRVESFAATGSILVSEEVAKLLKNQKQLYFQSMGEFQFKNVRQAKELFAIRHEGLAVPAPGALSGKGYRETPKHNLPSFLSSFVGREAEIQEVVELVKLNRLITLTGPGGSGKTRLSIKIGERLLNQFQNGLRWIPLSSVMDPDMLGFAIAEGLGLKPSIIEVQEVLIEFLSEKEMLLILDNFEQIIESSPLVEALLIHCPNIKILVTSRIVLNIFGEVEYPVQPLPLPEKFELMDLNALKSNPAVDLFCQRAQKTRRRFELTAQNAEHVVGICQRLDGLPLALELAAARTKIFSPEVLLQRLGKSLDVLKVKNQQLPERHQTLRQTIAWSYDLLEKKEQELLCRFSVFVGGSDLEAIESVCVQNGLSDWDFEEGIENLIDKSLINLQESADRFYMLETIREFASDQLKESSKDQRYKLAHVQYYLNLAERASKNLNLRNEESKNWLKIIYQEIANLKAAIDYAIELGEMKLAYRLGLALRPFWSNQGSFNEGIRILNKILIIPVIENLKKFQLQLKESFGIMNFYNGVFLGLEELFEECLAFWTKEGNEKKIVEVLNHLLFVQANNGNLSQGEKTFEQVWLLSQKFGDKALNMRVLNNLGYLYFSKGELDKAIETFEKILPIARDLGDERWIGYTYSNMSIPLIYKTKYQEAIGYLLKALKRHRKAREFQLIQHAIHQAIHAYFEMGDYEKCEALFKESQEVKRISFSEVSKILISDTAARIELAKNHIEKADAIVERYIEHLLKKEPPLRWKVPGFKTKCFVAFAQKKHDEVKRFTLIMFDVDKSQTSYLTLTPAIELSARLAIIEENYETSAQLYHKAQQLRTTSGMPVPNSEKEIIQKLEKELISKLGAAQFKKLRAIGESLSLEEAVNLSKEILNH